MRILIYGLNFSPEQTGVGKYTSEMAAWLASQGHDVRVISAPMYYPAWRVGPGFSAKEYQAERCDGVTVVRCPVYVPAKPSGLRRCIHLASFALSSLPVALWQAFSWKPDVIFTIAPTLLCAPAAWLSSRAIGATSWLHYQDLEVDAAFAMRLLGGKIPRWIASTLERWLIRRFDVVSTISGRMADKLKEKGALEHRMVSLPNWVDTHAIRPLGRVTAMRRELGIPENATVALYSGSMNEKSGLETIVSAAQALANEPEIVFVLCGDGCSRKRIQESARNLPNVFFLPLQPAERLNDLLNMADIHLLPQQTSAADLVMPSKLTAILSAGGAVVAASARGTEIDNVLRKISAGPCPPGDAPVWAARILELARDVEERKSIGERARMYAMNHCDKRHILSGLAQQLMQFARV
jgi:colanic acid biosynthesis glycosyl transferase WcaI